MTSPLPLAELAQIMQAAFPGAQISLRDDTAKHAGHAGNGGGGHYVVRIVWPGFAGHNRLARQRLVHAALASPLQAGRIHALSLTLQTPDEAA